MALPEPRAPRYASLDLWRGVACLLVLVNHAVSYKSVPSASPGLIESVNIVIAAVAQRLWIGVPIFFVISGYCITAAIDGYRRKNKSVGEYFLRRFRRIFPPYWVVLAATAAIVGVLDILLAGAISRGDLYRPWWFTPTQWFGSISLTEIWRPHVFGSPKALYLGHAWTLCYEEQFYAVTGILLLLCPRRFFAGAAVVSVAVAALVPIALFFKVPIDGFFFDGSWLQFALGVLLYHSLNYAGATGRRMSALTFALVVLAAASYGAALLDPVKNQAQVYFVAGAFSLIALWLHPRDSVLMTSPRLQPLRTCGLMCYSLYLVHLPVTDVIVGFVRFAGVDPQSLSPLISLPLCGIPAVWIAWRFHIAVERRFMRLPTSARTEPLTEGLAMA